MKTTNKRGRPKGSKAAGNGTAPPISPEVSVIIAKAAEDAKIKAKQARKQAREKSRASKRKSKHLDDKVLIPTTSYPCRWDELLDGKTKEVVMSICCQSGKADDEKDKEGMCKADDGVWDIYIPDEVMTAKRLVEVLDAWKTVTGNTYRLQWDENHTK